MSSYVIVGALISAKLITSIGHIVYKMITRHVGTLSPGYHGMLDRWP